MTKATHLGGSGLEYRPIDPTDYLKNLRPVYDEQTRILKQQHNYLRERDRQMVERAKQQDDLVMAIGKFAPTLAKYAAKKRREEIERLKKEAEDELPEDDDWWGGEDDDESDDEKKPGDGKKPKSKMSDLDDPSAYRENSRALKRSKEPINKLIRNSSLSIVLKDKILNSHGAKKIAWMEVLLARRIQSSHPQAFEEEFESNLDYKNKLHQATNDIDRENIKNRAYQKWIKERIAPFNPTKGMRRYVVDPELKRLTQTRNTQVSIAAEKKVLTDRHNELKQALAVLPNIGHKDGADAAANFVKDAIDETITLRGLVSIPGGLTATQQANEIVVEQLLDLIDNEVINKDTLNKLNTGKIFGHEGGDTLVKAYWDKDGLIYNLLTDRVRAVGLAEYKAKEATEKQDQQIFLADIEDKTDKEISNELARLSRVPWKNDVLEKKLQDYSNQKLSAAQFEAKALNYHSQIKDGLLLSKNFQENIKKETNPILKKELEEKTNIANARLGIYNYDYVRDLITNKVEGSYKETAPFARANKTVNTEKAVNKLMKLWGQNVEVHLEGLKDKEGNYGFDNKLGINALNDTLSFYDNHGGGSRDKSCVGIFCVNPSTSEFDQLIETEKVQLSADETFNIPYSVGATKWLQQNANTLPKLLEKHGSYATIAAKEPGAFLSNIELLGVVQNARPSDKLILQAKYAGMELDEFKKTILGALVNSDDQSDKAFVQLHNLAKTEKELNAKESFTSKIVETLKEDTSLTALDIKYAIIHTGWDNLSGPKQEAIIGYMKSAAEVRKSTKIGEGEGSTTVGQEITNLVESDPIKVKEAERLEVLKAEQQKRNESIEDIDARIRAKEKKRKLKEKGEDTQLSFNLTEGVKIANAFMNEARKQNLS